MFLGPIELHKPWNTDGIEGVSKFLKKFWNLFESENNEFGLNLNKPTEEELKILHKSIKKISEDIEKLSFNTCVSQFMIATNELSRLNCHKKSILEPLLILMSPFAPHITEELWHLAGHTTSISKAIFPEFNPEFIKEDHVEYPVSINGKLRCKQVFPLDLGKEQLEKEIVEIPQVQKWLEGLTIRKVVIVHGRIINIVAN